EIKFLHEHAGDEGATSESRPAARGAEEEKKPPARKGEEEKKAAPQKKETQKPGPEKGGGAKKPGPQPGDDWHDFVRLDIYGRGNNAYRWAGETDVLEAIDAFFGVERGLGREPLL